MKNRKPTQIRLLSLGEGSLKGIAAAHAEKLLARGRAGKVVAVDFARAAYELPPNMQHLQGNALALLQAMQPNSVKILRDDFSLHTMMSVGLGPKNFAEFVGVTKKLLKKPGPDEDVGRFIRENIDYYFAHAKRVLAPGGRFIITITDIPMPYADMKYSDFLVGRLFESGFKVSSRELRPEEISKHGSPNAKEMLSSGQKIVRIVATKPRG